MKKFIYPILFTTLGVFLFALQSNAACVNSAAGFQAALTTAIAGDNNIMLVSGTYAIPADIHFNIETSRSLTISGGWNGDCTVQTINSPGLTNLEGGATQAALDGGGVLLVILDNDVNTPITFSISNLSIRNGSSIYDGGGLSIAHGLSATAEATATIDISSVKIELNTTEEWFGSGIAISDYGTDGGIDVNITRSLVQTNGTVGASAALPGPGGIFIDNYGAAGGRISIESNKILNNTAEADSGGLFINNGAKNLILVNNVIAGNESLDGTGGGLQIENLLVNAPASGGNVTLTNNTITGNFLTGLAGGGISVYMDDPASILNIYNNIIYGNGFIGPAGDGADIDIFNDNPGIVVNIYNNDFDNTPTTGFSILNATGNMANNLNNVDPLFVSAVDYHLTVDSPVIDMGDNFAPSLPVKALDGKLRISGPAVDIGAYEYGQPGCTFFVLPNGIGGAAVICL